MQRVLITGVAGFIGSVLAERLLSIPGVEVVGIDSLTDYYSTDLKSRNLSLALDSGLELHRADLNTADLLSLLDGVDTVFHQAGQPGVRPSWGKSFVRYIDDNIAATQALLEAARHQTALARVVYASSSSVYGNAQRYPTYETDRPQPLSPYGVTKLAAEHLCGLYAKNFGVPTVSLRYFTVYGPRQRPDMAFTRFIVRCLTGQAVPLFGDGSAVRDFTFVDDIVRANIAAATAPDVPAGSVFNVSGGSSVDMKTVMGHIEDLCGRPMVIDNLPAVPGDVTSTGGDASSAAEVLGWVPETGIEDGLAKQVEWARSVVDDYRGLV